jgi:hypothetical protein
MSWRLQTNNSQAMCSWNTNWHWPSSPPCAVSDSSTGGLLATAPSFTNCPEYEFLVESSLVDCAWTRRNSSGPNYHLSWETWCSDWLSGCKLQPLTFYLHFISNLLVITSYHPGLSLTQWFCNPLLLGWRFITALRMDKKIVTRDVQAPAHYVG